MKLSEIIKDSCHALDYMERVVNNGSPSGFTEINTSSPYTNPFLVKEFLLLKIESSSIKTFGDIPKKISDLQGFLIHPDWRETLHDSVPIKETGIAVSPTSSFRTVKVKGEQYYLKLSYPGVIGRMRRDLDERHIQSCIQITEILKGLMSNHNVPTEFSFMPEAGGCLIDTPDIKTGMVVRGAKPLGKNTDKICYIIPAFSLFGTDRCVIQDKPLLMQIIDVNNLDKEMFFSQYIKPLIDIYFSCLLLEGLSAEMHSQNILFGFDKQWNVVSVILRDLESIDKDITIRKKLNKSPFVNDYKSIKESDYNYKIKHSFMFDHKLGEYLIAELIKCASTCHHFAELELRKKIKIYVWEKYGHYLPVLFPSNGKWYKFQDVEIDHDKPFRPYVALDNSILR